MKKKVKSKGGKVIFCRRCPKKKDHNRKGGPRKKTPKHFKSGIVSKSLKILESGHQWVQKDKFGGNYSPQKQCSDGDMVTRQVPMGAGHCPLGGFTD